MDDGDVLAMVNAININYVTKQTLHMKDSDHFDMQTAKSRLERPCGYFTVDETETVNKVRTESVPDPTKKEENFPSLSSAMMSGGKKKGAATTASAMITREVQYTVQVPITDLKKTGLNKLDYKTHLNQLLKKFFWSVETLHWTIEVQQSGAHMGSQVAIVRGPIPDPYGGMTDSLGKPYRSTGQMAVVLGGTSGANYQVITAYPV